MKTDDGKNIQIRIRLPQQIVEALKEEARSYGFNLNEWTNYILTEKAVNKLNQRSETEDFAKKLLFKYKLTPHNYPYVDEQKLENLIATLSKD